MQLTTRSVHQTTSGQHAPCSGQYAADNNVMQRNMQHAACCRQRGIKKRPLTTGNKATRQHAACSRHRAEDGKTMQRMQQTTCNTQQTTCKRTRAHASCNKETHGTTEFRARRAAGSGQAACAKHCPRQPVRSTAQTPHTRCYIRPVPQHAANTRGTDNTQQALKRTDETNRTRTLAHLQAGTRASGCLNS